MPGIAILPLSDRNVKKPYASQKEPQVPCAAVAKPSRALNAHIAARNWANPPKIIAKGNKYDALPAPPYHPARLAATMNVAPANPYRPKIDGAAMGCKLMRGAASRRKESFGSIALIFGVIQNLPRTRALNMTRMRWRPGSSPFGARTTLSWKGVARNGEYGHHP